MNRQRITLRLDLSLEQDEAHVEFLLGEGWEFEGLLVRVFESAQQLGDSLSRGLWYFGKAAVPPPATIPELIKALEERIPAFSPSEAYLNRFMGDLDDCRFVHDEFLRISQIYASTSKLKLLSPLADLGDWLITAAMQWNESMHCEHKDYE